MSAHQNQKRSLLVQNCVFEDNRGSWDGGAIATPGTQPTIINCSFSASAMNGSANSYYHYSGGLSTLIGCRFIGNHSHYWGGAISIWDADALITNTVFFDNSCGNFTGNGNGGAISIYDPSTSSPRTVTITNCTFANNTANPGSGSGDAISNRVQNLVLTNCIFWDNDGGHGVTMSSGGTGTAGYCDFQGGVPSGMTNGGNNMNLDPVFKDQATGDLDLLGSSPCIDMGDNAAPGVGTEDVLGRNRIVDGDSDTVAVVDMGAYEYHSPIWPLLPTWRTAPEFNDVLDLVAFINQL